MARATKSMHKWTFEKLGSKSSSTDEAAASAIATATATWGTSGWATAATVALILASAAAFGVGWALTDGFWGIFKAPDMSSGSYIFSAMQLRKVATGNGTDDDLEQVVHFVLSDMGGKWTYRELEQRGGVMRMDTVLFYHPDVGRAQPDRFAYNQQLNAMLPDRMHYHKSQSWWGTKRDSGAASCICGFNNVDLMQIFYNSDSAMNRVAVVAHEYYHVLQIHYCPTVYDERTHFVMWLSEGAATVMQNLYVTKWLSGHWSYYDSLFHPQWGHVKQMMDFVQDGYFTYDNTLNTYAGAQNNYIASTTAILYLMYRKGGSSYLQYMLVDFLFSGECDLAAHGGMDAGFSNAFGIWPTLDHFYADLNAFLANATASSIELLRPSNEAVMNLFNHTTLCSDACVTSRDGMCDVSCAFGSDCTDCGPVAMPDVWPIELRYEWFDASNALSGYFGVW